MNDDFLNKLEELKNDINNLPNGREKALVITKLDEARLWYEELKRKSE